MSVARARNTLSLVRRVRWAAVRVSPLQKSLRPTGRARRSAADDKRYHEREGLERAMGVKTYPLFDTGDDFTCRAVRRVMSWKRHDSSVVRSQDADDFVLVAVGVRTNTTTSDHPTES